MKQKICVYFCFKRYPSRGLITVLFLSVWTGTLCLAYLSDISCHRRSFIKLEWAAAVLSHILTNILLSETQQHRLT